MYLLDTTKKMKLRNIAATDPTTKFNFLNFRPTKSV